MGYQQDIFYAKYWCIKGIELYLKSYQQANNENVDKSVAMTYPQLREMQMDKNYSYNIRNLHDERSKYTYENHL